MLRSAAQLGAIFHITAAHDHFYDRPLDLSGPRSEEHKPRKASPKVRAKRKAQRDARKRNRKGKR